MRRKRLVRGLSKKVFRRYGKLKVVLVDGTKIRNKYAVDFVFAGHHKAYAFIPQNEVWIEKSVPVVERDFILLHELYERNLMAKGFGYDIAHGQANKFEAFARKHPAGLKDLLVQELRGGSF